MRACAPGRRHHNACVSFPEAGRTLQTTVDGLRRSLRFVCALVVRGTVSKSSFFFKMSIVYNDRQKVAAPVPLLTRVHAAPPVSHTRARSIKQAPGFAASAKLSETRERYTLLTTTVGHSAKEANRHIVVFMNH